MKISDITFTYTIDRVLKNKNTGLIDEVMYTYSGTADGVTSSVPNNKQVLISSDPTATDFIDIENVTKENVIAWIDTSISEVTEFDIEEARVTDLVSWLDADDPKQPSKQDLTNFKHSSYKQQMQENIRATIEIKAQDITDSKERVEHTW